MKKSGKHALVFTTVFITIMVMSVLAGMIFSRSGKGRTGDGSPSGSALTPVPTATPAPTATPEPPITTSPTPTSEPTETLTPTPKPLPQYDEYLATNPYVAGWLTIDGTKINDPVVYTPGSQNYFLHRALDGSYSEKGTFFIAVNWREGFHNTLIYGHNMKDGSGFGSLQKFADENFGRKHNIITFDTLYEDREYELLGVFYSQIDEDELETENDREVKDRLIAQAGIEKKKEELRKEQEQKRQEEKPEPSPEPEPTKETGKEPTPEPTPEITPEPTPEITAKDLTVADLDLHREFGDEDIYRVEKDEDNGRFRYYYYNDLASEDDFDYFVSNVKEKALYDTGVDAKYGDDLLTLSTCSYQVKNGRFVVVAVRRK